MRIITTHLSADLDAFAAAVVAVRLYPGYRVLFPGSLEPAVRRFLADTEIPFPELKLREARRHRIEHAVVVDTRSPRRLGEVWGLISAAGCPVTLIDHHVAEAECLQADEIISEPVGATCTILCELMQQQGLVPSPEEASLLMMGIHEDTGGLTYRETTSRDLRAAAWLVDHQAALEWVRRWVLKGLQPEELRLLNSLVTETEQVLIHGVQVSLAMVHVDRYHEEAAHVVHRWMETFEIPVGIAMLVNPPVINLILRSRLPGLDMGRVARHFGGGGHATAASARVSDRMQVQVRQELLGMLELEMPPPLAARDIASRQIFSVDLGTTVDSTKQRLNELRVNALPVRDPATDTLAGTVTRQVLDRAVAHGLGSRPVSAVMQPDVPRVGGDASLESLRDLFLERSYRFVVVEDAGRSVGLVTRMELFRRLFERQHAAGERLDRRMAGSRPTSQLVTHLLREKAPAWVRALIAQIRTVADTRDATVYMVGGGVRDLLLERRNDDLDLVVEGDGIAFAAHLAEATGGRYHPHRPFLTAVIVLPDGHRVDVASARTEFYRAPAALPEVQTSLIRQDLYRRDFTINSLAIALSGDRWGQLLDFFGGRKDLSQRKIRVLHSLSFIDDPTRAIRAVRYARRLAFEIAPDTDHLIRTAVAEGAFAGLTGQRLLRELRLLLAEAHPTDSLTLLENLGLLSTISPELLWSEAIRTFLLELEGEQTWYEIEHLGALPEPWLLFLGGLVLHAGEGAGVYVAERLQLAGEPASQLAALPEAVAEVRAAAAAGLRLSERARCIERHPPAALLLAMASVELEPRRRLADAASAAARSVLPLAGRDLVDAGIPPGPWIGAALRDTHDALLDGTAEAETCLELALTLARAGQHAADQAAQHGRRPTPGTSEA